MDVESFDSWEEMMQSLRRRREAADARALPWQAGITPGDYFRRESGYGFATYGEVLPDEQRRPADLRHFRFCRCYSVACPDGELGDVHVSVVARRLSAEQFQEARQRGWFP